MAEDFPVAEADDLPVIILHSCPGKVPVYRNRGEDSGIILGPILADLEYASDPANQEEISYQLLCDDGCKGPIMVPRQILGVQFGEKKVCPMGYKDYVDPRAADVTW